MDAMAHLRRLAPTRARAMQNLAELTLFLEECLRNMDDNGMAAWPHGGYHREGDGGEDDSGSQQGEEQEASGRGQQWAACVRHLLHICMPHVAVAQVRVSAPAARLHAACGGGTGESECPTARLYATCGGGTGESERTCCTSACRMRRWHR